VPLALGTTAVVLLVLLWELARPRLTAALARRRARFAQARREGAVMDYDPGRERRAEQRARTLLCSCIGEEDWAMYRDLGFLRVWGGVAGLAGAHGPRRSGGDLPEETLATGVDPVAGATGAEPADEPRAAPLGAAATNERSAEHSYAYLIYPHRPIVAYLPRTGALLNEYCVAFPDHSKPYGSARLPDSDDVLAKWMALTADERRLIADANMHLPGRQIDPDSVRRDLLRLARWERERAARRPDSVRAA
jgi:hypothetical protein